MKIATVVGARPQFVKMGPLSRLFKKKIQEVIIHTGQHYDDNLSEIFFRELDLFKPEYNLGINPNTASGSIVPVHETEASQIARMMIALEKVFIKERPDIVLTYGDTNSTLACALTSSKLNLPLAHVEAGVRGFDMAVPEEINRIIVDRVSTLLFCPTKTAVRNLKNEGMEEGVFYTGDVMVEVLKQKVKRLPSVPDCTQRGTGYVLVTLHRQENVDRRENLEEIVGALRSFRGRLIFPVHPRTRKNLKRFKLWQRLNSQGSITILEPQGYLNFLSLAKNADRILTDSGGIQKEAYLLKVPCATIRTTTEWPETLESGWNRLIPCKRDAILRALKISLRPGPHRSIFGNEKASEEMFKIITSWLQKR